MMVSSRPFLNKMLPAPVPDAAIRADHSETLLSLMKEIRLCICTAFLPLLLSVMLFSPFSCRPCAPVLAQAMPPASATWAGLETGRPVWP